MANVRAREQMPEKGDPLEQLRQGPVAPDAAGWITLTHEELEALETDLIAAVRRTRFVADRVFGERSQAVEGQDEQMVRAQNSVGGAAHEVTMMISRIGNHLHDLCLELERLERL